VWEALERVAQAVDRLSRVGGIVAGGLALVMMATIGREVVGRYFFNAPSDWVVELDGYLLVALVYLAGGYILRVDGHIRVDLLYSRLAPRRRAWADLLGVILALPFLAFVVWQGSVLAGDAWRRDDRSVVMNWPLWPAELAVPVGALLLLLQALALGVRTARGLREGRDRA